MVKMKHKTLKKNLGLLAMIFLLLGVFALVLYFATAKIYEKEAERAHGVTVAQMDTAQGIVKALLETFSHDLLFLARLPSLHRLVNGGFGSREAVKEFEAIIAGIISDRMHYRALALDDESGRTVLRVTSRPGQPPAVQWQPDREVGREKRPSMADGTGALRARPLMVHPPTQGSAEWTEPEMNLVSAVDGPEQKPVAHLSLSLDLRSMLNLLPRNTSLQTQDGVRLFMGPGETVRAQRSSWNVSGQSGWLSMGPDETIHFRWVELTPGQGAFLVVEHMHPQLKYALRWLMLGSLALMVLVLGLVAAVGYVTISRYTGQIRAQEAMLFSLAGLAEGRDPETGSHLERTRRYAVTLARRLAEQEQYRRVLTPDFIDDLYEAAPLHDIGKVGIPDSILLKESGLTKDEFEEMKGHVLIAKRVLKDTIDRYGLRQRKFAIALNIAAQHHEKFNGGGYPGGLKGEDIPIEARIFALCDAYDAIRSKRSYKMPLPHEEAIKRIVSDAGTHFDPTIVKAFVECEKEFLAISQAESATPTI